MNEPQEPLAQGNHSPTTDCKLLHEIITVMLAMGNPTFMKRVYQAMIFVRYL